MITPTKKSYATALTGDEPQTLDVDLNNITSLESYDRSLDRTVNATAVLQNMFSGLYFGEPEEDMDIYTQNVYDQIRSLLAGYKMYSRKFENLCILYNTYAFPPKDQRSRAIIEQLHGAVFDLATLHSGVKIISMGFPKLWNFNSSSQKALGSILSRSGTVEPAMVENFNGTTATIYYNGKWRMHTQSGVDVMGVTWYGSTPSTFGQMVTDCLIRNIKEPIEDKKEIFDEMFNRPYTYTIKFVSPLMHIDVESKSRCHDIYIVGTNDPSWYSNANPYVDPDKTPFNILPWRMVPLQYMHAESPNYGYMSLDAHLIIHSRYKEICEQLYYGSQFTTPDMPDRFKRHQYVLLSIVLSNNIDMYCEYIYLHDDIKRIQDGVADIKSEMHRRLAAMDGKKIDDPIGCLVDLIREKYTVSLDTSKTRLVNIIESVVSDRNLFHIIYDTLFG